MSQKLGTLKHVRNGMIEELHGDIRTLQLSVKIRLIPEPRKMSDLSPDYKVYAVGMTGELVDIGGAWKRTVKKLGDVETEMLSITIDDSSFTNSLNIAAFKNDEGGWTITWRRRQEAPALMTA